MLLVQWLELVCKLRSMVTILGTDRTSEFTLDNGEMGNER